jgi:hypothetical protein
MAGRSPQSRRSPGACRSKPARRAVPDEPATRSWWKTRCSVSSSSRPQRRAGKTREALIELGKDIARRKVDAEFNEAQIVFANANARMELAPPGDDEATKAAEAANRRLLALFKKGWKKDEGLLFHCYREYKKRLCYHHRTEG